MNFKNILNALILIEASVASLISSDKFNDKYVGSYFVENICDTILKENEAIVSENGKYRLALNDDGRLLLLDSKYQILWESHDAKKKSWYARPPYSLALADDGQFTVVDRNVNNIWGSLPANGSPRQGPYEIVLNDEGQLYIKDTLYSVPPNNPDTPEIDEDEFRKLCYSFDGSESDDVTITHYKNELACSFGKKGKFEEHYQYCINTLNSTFGFDPSGDICVIGKKSEGPISGKKNPAIKDKSINYTWYVLSNGETSGGIYEAMGKPSRFENYHYCQKLNNSTNWVGLDSTQQSVLFPYKKLSIKNDEGATLEYELTPDQFAMKYFKKIDNHVYIRSYVMYMVSNINKLKSRIAMAELCDDAVLRIYNYRGDVLYEFGEVCPVKGRSVLTLEPTDAYIGDESNTIGDIPLTHGLVIRNARGGKFYHPPRKAITKKSTTTTTTTTTITTTATTTTTTSTSNAKPTIYSNSICGQKDDGIYVCSDDRCCSKYGYCGTKDEYCGAGCQLEFGQCKNTDTITTTTTTVKKSKPTVYTSGVCGEKEDGIYICSKNRCCSKYGYCGNSIEYCGTGCQSSFGNCN